MNLVFLCRLKLPDKSQIPANRVVYIENTAMFVQIAEGLWIPSILHTDLPVHVREIGFVGTAEWRRSHACYQVNHAS